MTLTVDVVVYASGLCCCSVCAQKDVPLDEVERNVNAQHPTGVASRWTKSSDETFADGTPNPSPCNDDPDRLHWLLEC